MSTRHSLKALDKFESIEAIYGRKDGALSMITPKNLDNVAVL